MAITATNRIAKLLRSVTSQLTIVVIAAAFAFAVPYLGALFSGSSRIKAAMLSPTLIVTQIVLALTLTLLLITSRTIWRHRSKLFAVKRRIDSPTIDLGNQANGGEGLTAKRKRRVLRAYSEPLSKHGPAKVRALSSNSEPLSCRASRFE